MMRDSMDRKLISRFVVLELMTKYFTKSLVLEVVRLDIRHWFDVPGSSTTTTTTTVSSLLCKRSCYSPRWSSSSGIFFSRCSFIYDPTLTTHPTIESKPPLSSQLLCMNHQETPPPQVINDNRVVEHCGFPTNHSTQSGVTLHENSFLERSEVRKAT